MDGRKDLGKRGEELALDYLSKRGLSLIEKNFNLWGGEIDIIMKDISHNEEEYVFVEVKTKTSLVVPFSESITHRQITTILKTAESWLLFHKLTEVNWRIDVVGVYLKNKIDVEIEWFPDAIS